METFEDPKNFRLYVLRVSPQFSAEKSLSLFGRLCDTQKNFQTIKKEAEKAFRAGYDRILLPWNFVSHPERNQLKEWIVEQPNHFILAVHKLSFKPFQKLFDKYTHKRLLLELNLESYESVFLKELEDSPWPFCITIPAHKHMDLESLSRQLNQRYQPKTAKLIKRNVLSLAGPKNSYLLANFWKQIQKLLNRIGITDNINESNSSLISPVSNHYKTKCHFYGRGHPTSPSKLKQELNKTAPQRIFVHFPCSHQRQPDLYNSKEIYDFLTQYYYPPPPYDIYNLSIPKDLKLEPENKAEIVYNLKDKTGWFYSFFGLAFQDQANKNSKTGKKNLKPNLMKAWDKVLSFIHKITKKPQHSAIKASVIITAYNCEKELLLTLKHLYQQDLPKKEWELIVVDDGSAKPLSQTLKNLKFLKEMNFKLIFLPRALPRTGPKDHRFRAGIARNLGAKYAKGENLLFLDADILVPPHYISSACKQLKTDPVVQHPRYHLTKSAPSNYKDINKSRHTFIKINNYWEKFYETAENWNEKKLPWKYISTNSLCLKTKLFNQVGRFRKNHTCWGFEDTDLGYRLYQYGLKFKLNPVNTYHLFRPSEFSNSKALRRELLGMSALTFFHNNHDLSSYKEFEHLYQNL